MLVESLEIVFRNIHYIVVNKPSGFLCQPGKLNSKKSLEVRVLINELRKQFPEDAMEWRPIHRLDRNVTGGVVVACTKSSAAQFSRNLKYGGNKGHLFHRKYLAMLSSKCDMKLPDEGRIIMEDMETDYRRLADDLVVLKLRTGKKHQIRKMMQQVLQQPIVNDIKYGAEHWKGYEGGPIGLHSAFIRTQVGLQVNEHLIPVSQDGTEMWAKWIDKRTRSFTSSIVDSLLEFEIGESELDRSIKFKSTCNKEIRIIYK